MSLRTRWKLKEKPSRRENSRSLETMELLMASGADQTEVNDPTIDLSKSFSLTQELFINNEKIKS